MLTLASVGGVDATPPRVFRDPSENAARQRGKTPATLWGIHCAHFGARTNFGSCQVTDL